MKIKLFTLVLMIAACCSVMAQNWLWEVPTIPADTTIVREWQAGKYIVYSRTGTSQTVSYQDIVSPNVRTAQIPPYVIINDFRIANDTVYAGGTILGTPYATGFLACFAINDLLGSGGAFHVLQFSSTPLGVSTCPDFTTNDLITGVKRLEVYKDGAVTRVAYIADDTVMDGGGGSSGSGCRRVGYGEVYFRGSMWIPNAFHYNKDAFNLFSDITVTDSHVVVVSRDCFYNRLEFVVHPRVANYAYLPPTPGCDIYYFTDHKIPGRVMTTALDGDKFAVAYHYAVSPSDTGLAVKVFNISAGVPVLLYSLEIPPVVSSTGMCQMRDIRYIAGKNELWILNDISNPITGLGGNYLYRIDMGNVYAGTYEMRHIDGIKFHSLDDLATGGFIASCSDPGMTTIYVEQITSPTYGCATTEYVNGMKTAPVLQQYSRHHCTYIPNTTSVPLPFNVTEEVKVMVCNSAKGGVQE